jgi:RarD protein
MDMKYKLSIISSMLIFGSIGIFVRNIELSSLEIAFLRAVIGSVFLVFISMVVKQRSDFNQVKKNLPLLIISGVAIGVNWILLFEAYKYTTISNATLSYYFAPVFVIVLAPIVLKEKFTLMKFSCICMAMIGLGLILNMNSVSSAVDANHLKGILLGLSAAALYASVILMNKFIKALSSFETTLIQLIVAALVLLPNILYKSGLNFSQVNLRTWYLILVLGIMHTGIAYFLYFTSIKVLESQSIAILSYIDPISAVIMAALFLNESMTILQLLGGLLILGSTFLSEKIQIRDAAQKKLRAS